MQPYIDKQWPSSWSRRADEGSNNTIWPETPPTDTQVFRESAPSYVSSSGKQGFHLLPYSKHVGLETYGRRKPVALNHRGNGLSLRHMSSSSSSIPNPFTQMTRMGNGKSYAVRPPPLAMIGLAPWTMRSRRTFAVCTQESKYARRPLQCTVLSVCLPVSTMATAMRWHWSGKVVVVYGGVVSSRVSWYAAEGWDLWIEINLHSRGTTRFAGRGVRGLLSMICREFWGFVFQLFFGLSYFWAFTHEHANRIA